MKDDFYKISKLRIGYNTDLTDEINFTLNSGEIICVIGINGSGKSTLLNTMAGVLKPRGGDIYINGNSFFKLSVRNKTKMVSYVPSKMEYLANITVYELASMGRSPYTNIFDKKSKQDIEIINESLAEFNLVQLKNKALYEISDGERQRAMICRSLIQETPIILLDEPTAFLDFFARQKLLKDLADLAKTKNKLIIFSSHDIEIALKYCSSVILFFENQLLSYGINEFCESEFYKQMYQEEKL